MLVHADNLSLFDVRAFVRQYEKREEGIEITMMTFNTTEPEACGIVELNDRGIVKAFHEKVENPPGFLANGAVYILSPSIMDFMGRINTFYNQIYHRDIGTIKSLKEARREFPKVALRTGVD